MCVCVCVVCVCACVCVCVCLLEEEEGVAIVVVALMSLAETDRTIRRSQKIFKQQSQLVTRNSCSGSGSGSGSTSQRPLGPNYYCFVWA
uniref:Bm244 n=1 Tax=Brugia malayi TaxID=6279 RepID=A0A1I9GCV4_BRUMA|nr:Bm244 [Brugia malayi]